MNKLEQLFEDEKDASIRKCLDLLSRDEKEALSIIYKAIKALPQADKDTLHKCITRIQRAKKHRKDV